MFAGLGKSTLYRLRSMVCRGPKREFVIDIDMILVDRPCGISRPEERELFIDIEIILVDRPCAMGGCIPFSR